MKRFLNLSLIAFITLFSLGILHQAAADTNYRNFKKQVSKPANKNNNLNPINRIKDRYISPTNKATNTTNKKQSETQRKTSTISKPKDCPKCQMQKPNVATPVSPLFDPKGSSLSVDASGSTNQKSLFCAYSSRIYSEIMRNLGPEILRVKICPAIAVEFILHHNGEITGARFVSTHKNSAYNQNVIDAVNKINLKNLNVTLPPNVSKYVKVKVTINGRGLCY